ncbi:MAG: DUF2938 domain-containing protein [Pseudomonadota bacterium]|nr:DUF2938 domain-containing protein [Pseudomonadota bacterium]
MPEGLELAVRAALVGIGATAVSDLWAWFADRAFGLPRPDWAKVGRWIGHFPRGRFVHHNIAAAAPVAGERPIGWLAHYAIGIFFAGLVLAIFGLDWGRSPTLLPALFVGVATVAATFLIMQPALGWGIASSKMPDPTAARLRSLANHTMFGICLYLAGLVVALLD